MSSFIGMQESKYLAKLSDGNLMIALQGGDDCALNELMRRYKNKLFNFIIRYTRNEDTSYDILQETFFRVYTRAETFNPAYKFKTWLYQISLNLCRDYSRKEKIKSLISLDTYIFGNGNDHGDDKNSLHDILSSDENIETKTEHKQALEYLDGQINKLPHKLKTALILFALEDNSQEECARILGTTPKTVEMRVYRARKILSQETIEKLK